MNRNVLPVLLMLAGCVACVTQPPAPSSVRQQVVDPVVRIAGQAAGGTLQLTEQERQWLAEVADRLSLPPIEVVDNAAPYSYVVGRSRTLVSAALLTRLDGSRLAAALANSYRSAPGQLAAPSERDLALFFPMLPHIAANAQRVFMVDPAAAMPHWDASGQAETVPPSIAAWSDLQAASSDPLAPIALDAGTIKDRVHAQIGYRAFEQRELESALKAFRRATSLHPDHFRHWLALGAAAAATGHDVEARDAYARSAELLPTADAYLGLAGLVADAEARLFLLEQAASAPGPAGQQAASIVVAEYFPEHANRFIGWTAARDSRGRLYVELENGLPIDVDVAVSISCDGRLVVNKTTVLLALASSIILAPDAASAACLAVNFEQTTG